MLSRQSVLSALATILVALTVTAHAQQAPQDACGLLSAAQIGSVLGASMKPGSPGPKNCLWGANGSDARLYLTLRDPATWAAFKSTVQSTGHYQGVSGLGDDAFFVGQALYVLKGSHVLLLIAHGHAFSDAQNQTAAKTLAAQALSSL